MNSLKNKTALVTGGSDGIGFAIAQAFAQEGARVIIIGRNKEKLEERRHELSQYGHGARTLAMDLGDGGDMDRVAEETRRHGLKLDILVNNAGIARFVPIEETDAALLDRHMDLNIKAPYHLTRAFLADLLATRGCVINISSYFARRMLPDRPSTAYSLTKGALNSFTKALAFELGPRGVRVNAIAPGTVLTPQVQANADRLDAAAKARFSEMVKSIYPLQTWGNPTDVADMAVFLASEKAGWITGALFPVDGGLTS